MSLPFGLLGLLTYRDSTGYELTKLFEHSLNNFWHAQSSQIYRELNRMEAEGWVTSTSVVQDKRPNKRVYAITEKGREALAHWLRQGEPVFENPHETLLMRLFFGADDTESTLALLKACRDQCNAQMAHYHPQVEKVIQSYADEIDGGQQKQLYWRMTLDFGYSQTQAAAQWAQRCIDLMEQEMNP